MRLLMRIGIFHKSLWEIKYRKLVELEETQKNMSCTIDHFLEILMNHPNTEQIIVTHQYRYYFTIFANFLKNCNILLFLGVSKLLSPTTYQFIIILDQQMLSYIQQTQPIQSTPNKVVHSQLITNKYHEKAAQLSQQKQQQIEQRLNEILLTIQTTKKIEEICSAIKEYNIGIRSNLNQDPYTSFFMENRFMQLLSKKIKQFKYSSELLQSIFLLFECLLQALKKDQYLIYFLVKVNQQGFISQNYNFQQQDDIPYYETFLKLMMRKINKQEKYLSVFFNQKEPHFPLLLKLLKFYDCPDILMHTSSKQSILQTSNNRNDQVQKYIKNFPFIIFYPLYVGQIFNSFKKAISEDNNAGFIEQMVNHLKYMQQFIEKKEREAVDIYTNVFLKVIGNFVYSEVASVTEKSVKRIKKMYTILLKYVLPQLTVTKIKTCLLILFNTQTTTKMRKCFTVKTIQLQTKYWLIDECLQQIIDHCKRIFYRPQSTNKSFLKTINSYIPRSKDNWLYYQLKKIQNLIGFNLTLGQQLSFTNYLQQSFLDALWTIMDDELIPNQTYQNIKQKDQQLLYYHIKILHSLSQCYDHVIKINFGSVIGEVSICNSLSLVGAFQELARQKKIRLEKSIQVQQMFEITTQKLIHFIMTKGMQQFLLRVQASKPKHSQLEFYQDIYREIQCEILFFIALRSILGFQNKMGTCFDLSTWSNKESITAQTSFKCRGLYSNGSELSLILDGQYLKIKNRNEHLIHKQQLLLQNIQFYDDEDCIFLNGNQKINNYSTTIHIDTELKQYLMKEINSRKEISSRICMIIRNEQHLQ